MGGGAALHWRDKTIDYLVVRKWVVVNRTFCPTVGVVGVVGGERFTPPHPHGHSTSVGLCLHLQTSPDTTADASVFYSLQPFRTRAQVIRIKRTKQSTKREFKPSTAWRLFTLPLLRGTHTMATRNVGNMTGRGTNYGTTNYGTSSGSGSQAMKTRQLVYSSPPTPTPTHQQKRNAGVEKKWFLLTGEK